MTAYEDDIDGETLFANSLPTEFVFGVMWESRIGAAVIIRPTSDPDYDQDIPMAQIAKNGGHTLPRGSNELNEVMWDIAAPADQVVALLTGMGFVYEPKMDREGL